MYPFHKSRISDEPPHQHKSPHFYQTSSSAIPTIQSRMYPNPCWYPPQLSHPFAQDRNQNMDMERQTLQSAIPVQKTFAGTMRQVVTDTKSLGRSEARIVKVPMSTESNKRMQEFASISSIIPHVPHCLGGKRNNPWKPFDRESNQISSESTQKHSSRSGTDEDHKLQIMPASSNEGTNRTSKRRQQATPLDKIASNPIPAQVENEGQKKAGEFSMLRKPEKMYFQSWRGTDGEKRRRSCILKQSQRKNAKVDQISTNYYSQITKTSPSDSTCSNERKGESYLFSSSGNYMTAPLKKDAKNGQVKQRVLATDVRPVDSESDANLVVTAGLERRQSFCDTCILLPRSRHEATETKPSRKGQKRMGHGHCTVLSSKNVPLKSAEFQQSERIIKQVRPCNASQETHEANPPFAKRTKLTNDPEVFSAKTAIPRIPLFPLPGIPEPPEEDETDDEHDKEELKSRFGKVNDGYIWHSRVGWVIHPSYYNREGFRLCRMHKSCKHSIDCQTTRFQMAVLSCAKKKLTTREAQFLWGTSRTGVAKRVLKFKEVPIRYLLVPVKEM